MNLERKCFVRKSPLLDETGFGVRAHQKSQNIFSKNPEEARTTVLVEFFVDSDFLLPDLESVLVSPTFL